jgi:diguanylate cyclase (GGDEF)-like protein
MTSNEANTQDRLAKLLALAINLEPVLFDKVLDAATIDELTGAYNQSFFINGLTNELNRSQALSYPLGLLLVSPVAPEDLSDELAELTRDKALRSAAAELVVISRTTDWTARSDDNELALILPGCPVERLRQLGQEIDGLINPMEVRLANGDSYQLELRVGGACHITGAPSVDRILRLAREAQLMSAQEGRVIVRSQEQLRWHQGAA